MSATAVTAAAAAAAGAGEKCDSTATSKRNEVVSLNDALELTKFGKFNYNLIVVAGTVLTAVVLETLGISFVIPVAECDMELTIQQKGLLSAIAFLGIIMSSHLWGFLADTKGRRAVIVPTLAIAFACSFTSSLVNSFWIFLTLRFFTGFFLSGSSATIYAFLGEYHTDRNRSRAIMGASAIFGVGCILLPGLAWIVINQDWRLPIPLIGIVMKPWRLFLIVCATVSLVCSISLSRVPESPKFVFSQGDHDGTIRILQTVYQWNTGCKKDTYPVKTIEEEPETGSNVWQPQITPELSQKKGVGVVLRAMWNQTVPLFRPPFLKRTLIACSLQFGINTTANGVYMWFPDILNRVLEFTEGHPNENAPLCNIISLYYDRMPAVNTTATIMAESMPLCNEELETATYGHTLVLEVLYAIGFALIGLLINRVGKLAILVFVLMSCGAAGILVVHTTIPIVAIYLFIVMLLAGFATTVVIAATVDLYPTNLRAMAFCISLMMGRIGSIAGANMVAALIGAHCEMTFYLAGLLLIGCGILSFFIPGIRKQAKLIKTIN